MKPPFVVSATISLALIAGCVYFWFFSENPGRFMASAFLVIGLGTYGTHAAMDIIKMCQK